MKQLILLAAVLSVSLMSYGQLHSLKGDGQVFWEEHFDWGNPSDDKGWTAPEGWLIEDNSGDDTGYVWVWTNDSMKGPFSERDGGYILNSTTGDNGFLAIDLDYLNAYKPYTEMLFVNSSITLPILDCSEHPSVIISLEQMFKYFNSPRMVIEVSNDAGAHWAEFDLKMGTGSATNTQNLLNDEVAVYMANLSEVAGGHPEVTIKITWDGSMLYFWMLDDITIREGWDYDVKMNHYDVELIDDNPLDGAGFYYSVPKTQILPMGGFEGSVINYGDIDLSDVHFNVAINKNGVEQFNESSEEVRYMFFADPADTLVIEQSYTPVDYGHYEINFAMKMLEEDQAPENNEKSFLFHVSDSVFARTPDINEANESPWRDYYQYTHEGDYMGVEFNPIADCEASSISVYIARANLDADFNFTLLEIEEGEGGQLEFIELLTTEIFRVDSAMLQNGWLTLPLEADGQGEFMTAGGRYIAAVQFWTYIEEEDLINRGNTFWIGSTQSYPDSYDKQWLFESYSGFWTQGSDYNKMIRLNINNHENIIDGVEQLQLTHSLDQNYPNPFTSETQIRYELGNKEEISLEIKDLTGRTVWFLDQGYKEAVKHIILFESTNLESGMYFYTLNVGNQRITKRMIVD
ncbi:MAG: T9SS type A sorting domain-containing protein [Bacteroidetes bacterium]|nr:T9SS type A sorting domain-containing protein [Bacteroidota bacterium]